MKKQDFILAGLLLLAPGTAPAASHLPTTYICTDPDNAGATCSYDPASIVRLSGRVKIQTREIYPSALPPHLMVDTVDIAVDCSKTSYRIITGMRKSGITVPATLMSAPVDRELLGSPYEGLFNAVCGKKK